ncbi:AraC family transcriptional regulator [Streptomyces virginiae]|uniref:AraC family transcriptional regulator n=1 Tax=Streptomyces virginiae TaxID=1961 RepID=A0ABQ3NQ29_STRVG|nr:AraC family transcriptional regulator [Streptomyces virginiae]MBP2341281.1 AraC family transcriptional regulator [Streptomyces virginiae]GGQ19573.1 AraC family transcriptional regulator [Streptomyces virginiae]GHI14861.1 AraC family transcriptional regulator [Streptomyces virginiae]
MLERLNQALDHLEAGLDREIDMAEVARIAGVSEYHFRRLFSALAGMPLPVYVRRRRMTHAGAEVLAGELTLLDVAVRYGYGSGEAFARAFRSVHGIGPGEARRTGAVLTAQPRMSFRVVVEGSTSMRYRIVEKESFRVVGRKATVPLVHEGLNEAASAHVESLDARAIVRMKALTGGEPEGILSAVVHLTDSREEGAEVDYWVGVVARPGAAAEGLDALDVPAGTWAVFDNRGPYPSALQELWRDVFTQWFPSNPYASRPGPELLLTQPVEVGAETDSQLWIPVERDR